MLEKNIPPHSKKCPFHEHVSGSIKILEPAHKSRYLLDKRSRIPIRVASGYTERRVALFLNGKFYRSVLPGETIFLEPDPGEYSLTAADYLGNSISHQFIVSPPD
jgi:hypothetical protein